ncbi:hypothetical protein BBJ28_00005881 [Nothophytophthora sp. Chile5]|nr:hypothetical protein BBJ28_00005881 [Nothophytophthora sp. Chile5]
MRQTAPQQQEESLTLVPVSGSGLGTSFRDVLLALDRQELVLAIGKHVVLQNMQTQELTFLSGQSQQSGGALGEITAMTLCGKRQYLSVCRAAVKTGDAARISPAATISIYNLGAASLSSHQPQSSRSSIEADPVSGKSGSSSSRRVLLLKTLSVPWAERLVSTALSPDGKLVSGQAANASWSLGVWDWGRGRQVALTDVHCRVSRVRFNAIDMAQLSTSGGSLLRVWTLCEYALKPLVSFKSGDETKAKHVVSYADHAWLPDDVLVAVLEDGDVQLIVNAELVQTLRSVHKGVGRLLCLSALSNGEGVVVGGTHGLVSVIRVASKMLKTAEKELHLQRRMRLPDTYGVYDLSNLCLLRGDDEAIALTPLASTPLSLQMECLSAASRRSCVAAACRLPDGDAAVHVWSQTDCHECCIAHSLEQQTPLSLDLHPSGSELLLSFASKLQIFFVLQDTLRLGFELPQKQLSLAQYSPSGALFAAVHAANRFVFVYRNNSRAQQEPQLVGVFRDFRDAVTLFCWALHDSSFFAVDVAGELLHCQLRWQTGGDVEDLVTAHSQAQVLAPGNAIDALASCPVDRDSFSYVVFVAERRAATRRGRHSEASCVLRAWVNGELTHDALCSSEGKEAGENIAFHVTALEAGPTVRGDDDSHANLLFAGTTDGAVAIFSWKRELRGQEGHPTVLLSPVIKRVDLHTAPVAGLFFAARSRLLLSNARNGVVLACRVSRATVDGGESSAAAWATAIRDEQSVLDATASAFVSICQPEELALFDRSKVELGRLQQLDLEGELQQVKLENELLSRQTSEQRERFEVALTDELAARGREAEQEQQELRSAMDARLDTAIREREARLLTLSEDGRVAQVQYRLTLEALQDERDSLREQLHATTLDLQDERKRAAERESQLEDDTQQQLEEIQQRHDRAQRQVSEQLELTQRKLQEVLRQQDQDQLAQLGLLASAIEQEKTRGAQQAAEGHGKAAALHQEVKMLLGALTHKDGELQELNDDYNDRMRELAALREKLAEERALTKRLAREKEEGAAQLAEQRRVFENLQRLDGMHRSQLELLQKHLLPKDRELAQMQQHLTQLHEANQEVVVQANMSDRLRAETSTQAKHHERDVAVANKQLERVRHSILVLQEELGELVSRSAVQEKSALVTEIGRLHKRVTRQLDALQARDDSTEEVNAELHRQNRFLLQNKHALRRQVEAGNREKDKLAAALSFQNAALLSELNTLRRTNKELERRVKCHEESVSRSGDSLGTRGSASARIEPSSRPEAPETDEEASTGFDGRRLMLTTLTSQSAGPAMTSSSSTQALTGRRTERRTTARPKSAAAGISTLRRPVTAAARGRSHWNQ